MAYTSSPLLIPRTVVHSVPGVPGLPLLGNLLAFRRDRLGLVEAAGHIGPIARLAIAHMPLYIVTDADLAHDVFFG